MLQNPELRSGQAQGCFVFVAHIRVGALLQENARLKREARIAAAERDSAVESLERITQKYNDLKRMRNIKRVTFVGGA